MVEEMYENKCIYSPSQKSFPFLSFFFFGLGRAVINIWFYIVYCTGNSTQCSVVTWTKRKFKKEGNMCIHMADSFWCTVEANTTL